MINQSKLYNGMAQRSHVSVLVDCLEPDIKPDRRFRHYIATVFKRNTKDRVPTSIAAALPTTFRTVSSSCISLEGLKHELCDQLH